MKVTAQNILKTLGYFDLFHYPLTREEIFLFHAENISRQDADLALETLLDERIIFRLDEFYSLQGDHLLAERRRKGNQLAASQMKTATSVARFLSKFPYVKGIAVSGSLSKNFATSKTDIDFFIITEANRLWIARSILHLYKKFTFLTGRQHWYCMNYFVDEAAMEITEKNIFTAMESVTLLPMQGKKTINGFISTNSWVTGFFPLKKIVTAGVPEIKPGMFRKMLEKTFNNPFGNKLDAWLMQITEKRWRKKTEQRKLNSHGHVMSMVVSRHVSKPDPKNFQHKVIEEYRVKVQQLIRQSAKTGSLVL